MSGLMTQNVIQLLPLFNFQRSLKALTFETDIQSAQFDVNSKSK